MFRGGFFYAGLNVAVAVFSVCGEDDGNVFAIFQNSEHHRNGALYKNRLSFQDARVLKCLPQGQFVDRVKVLSRSL